MLPKPGTVHLCTRPGNHRIARASSTFVFQEAVQRPGRRLAAAPDTLPREPEGACAGADGYSHLGSCPAVTGAAVLCSPACSSRPSAALASIQSMSTLQPCHGMAIAKLLVVQRAWSGAELASLLHSAPSCEAVQAPGLTLCHCAWVASALGRARQAMLQLAGAEEQRVRPQCSGQAWGTAPLSSP